MTTLDRKNLPNNPELKNLLDQDEAWNIIYDSHTRSTPEAMAQQIFERYNDRDCDTIAMAVIIKAMSCIGPLMAMGIRFDDELRRLMGMKPADDPLTAMANKLTRQ